MLPFLVLPSQPWGPMAAHVLSGLRQILASPRILWPCMHCQYSGKCSSEGSMAICHYVIYVHGAAWLCLCKHAKAPLKASSAHSLTLSTPLPFLRLASMTPLLYTPINNLPCGLVHCGLFSPLLNYNTQATGGLRVSSSINLHIIYLFY